MGLSKALIIQAAYDFVKDYGVESLSMRKLGDILNVKAMSLYNHIRNKEEIIDELTDMVIAQIALPDESKNWRNEMRKRAFSAHRVLLDNKWAVMPVVSRLKSGPGMFAYFDRTLACLRSAGFSLIQADYAINVMDSHIFGFTIIQMNFPIAEKDYAKAAKEALPYISKATYPALHELTQLIKGRKYRGIQDFAFGLDFILDGLIG